MDPDTALATLRQWCLAVLHPESGYPQRITEDEAAEAFDALDRWKVMGGHDPEAWHRDE